ncbi:phage holin family protein [uncultured Aggregatibacter sp.]|uniref:phage holin family protein n=1 Tax=uncultured Aggregatibacter sp. TaxID=470564 RepID=UPI0025D4D39E|nr:phage holin family protein [uncultured Aggregatibacter sp.]
MQIIQKIKNTLITTLELTQIRLQMLRIDFIQLKNSLLSSLIIILFSSLLLLVSFISLLFGLDSYLAPENKITVFFSISVISLFIVFILAFGLSRFLKKQKTFMMDTVIEIQQDISTLKNIIGKSKQE